jgi:hypothetical protein
MSADDVRARLAEICGCDDDNETAHILEDALHRDVLLAIAEGAENGKELAKLALKSRDIDFSRWYA